MDALQKGANLFAIDTDPGVVPDNRKVLLLVPVDIGDSKYPNSEQTDVTLESSPSGPDDWERAILPWSVEYQRQVKRLLASLNWLSVFKTIEELTMLDSAQT
jgi:hypothetical protein